MQGCHALAQCMKNQTANCIQKHMFFFLHFSSSFVLGSNLSNLSAAFHPSTKVSFTLSLHLQHLQQLHFSAFAFVHLIWNQQPFMAFDQALKAKHLWMHESTQQENHPSTSSCCNSHPAVAQKRTKYLTGKFGAICNLWHCVRWACSSEHCSSLRLDLPNR